MSTNTITLDEARRIAYEWHGGGGSPLYSFASTSHDIPRNISPDTVKEVETCLYNEADAIIEPDTDAAELYDLRAFLIANMPPQDDNE